MTGPTLDPDGVRLELGVHHAVAGTSLSGATTVGPTLVVAPDEGASLVSLRRGRGGGAEPDWGAPRALRLADLVDLPGDPDDPGHEVDAEALDAADGVLWVAGSHSAKRKRVKPGTPRDAVAKRLARVAGEKARRVLARIPFDHDGELSATGAARLPSGRRGLLGVLAGDEHLGPFLAIPGKDNGFDVEGLAIVPSGVLLGLRGPVLRGWAVVLELDVAVAPHDPGRLALHGLRKIFLDLAGLGVRDLARDGDDLLVLAGPTMALSGPARVLRVAGGAVEPLPPAVLAEDLEVVTPLAVGEGDDHPEAITMLPEGLLVLHDSPAPERVHGTTVRADLLRRA